jgi:glycosyltransferase involved in cell wall biosynthesis
MASGLPVIATNVGGSAEIVRHGESGILVSPFAPAEIAHSARLLAKDLDLCARMGRRGRALAESKFSLRSMVEAHEHLYENASIWRASRELFHTQQCSGSHREVMGNRNDPNE